MKWLVALLIALVAATPLVADDLRPGYMEWTETAPGEWRLAWKQPLNQPPVGEPPLPVLPEVCQFAGDPTVGAGVGALVGSAEVTCTAPIEGQAIGMAGMLGQADMLVRIAPLKSEIRTLRLTAAQPSAVLEVEAPAGNVWRTYFVLGVEHILAGWDHLLFVIALVLLVRGWKRVVAAATAFTVAHSITLAGASLGLVGLPARPVEAIIALSIVFLAWEVLRAQRGEEGMTQRLPWVVAFLFGLVHGFGFAGALNEIGLPEGEVVAALLAFNIGVEAGQLLVVALVLLLLEAVRRIAHGALAPAVRVASYGIGITGAYWLVERVVG
ncbi:HupE/UreJ family protein [Erythrobacter sp. HKB08]|uniref:HupE/UreJ family protein n=1 Tax=Erythrobacter sp. HKB08 TaxID=2502843 RepID=UPI001F2ACADB|nr:HupE/UreJ family protein [Erythrobacter sp. HKB08]